MVAGRAHDEGGAYLSRTSFVLRSGKTNRRETEVSEDGKASRITQGFDRKGFLRQELEVDESVVMVVKCLVKERR